LDNSWPTPPTYVQNIRLLCCEFEIRTNSWDVINRFSHVTQSAEQDVPVLERGTVIVTWTGDEFRISGDGMEDDFELSVTSVVETLYQRLHGRAVAALPDHIRISGGSGTHARGSFIIIGPEGAGKTTLALNLMLEGIDITGDALVLLRDGKALPFPRRFFAREDSIGRIPSLRVMDRFAGYISNPQSGRVIALDPLEFGKPWRIAPSPVSALLYAEPNHGGRSTLRRSGKLDMTRRLLQHCLSPISGRRDWLADLCATVDRSETFVIELGDLDLAVAEIKRLLI
jgi:hypothetical protein